MQRIRFIESALKDNEWLLSIIKEKGTLLQGIVKSAIRETAKIKANYEI